MTRPNYVSSADVLQCIRDYPGISTMRLINALYPTEWMFEHQRKQVYIWTCHQLRGMLREGLIRRDHEAVGGQMCHYWVVG